jgi:hypothetical protein
VSIVFLSHIFWFHPQRWGQQYDRISNGNLIVTFVFALVGSIFAVMLIFVWWNWGMVTSNQTSIETNINASEANAAMAHGRSFRNPYDVGNDKNEAEVFGTGRLMCCGVEVADAEGSGGPYGSHRRSRSDPSSSAGAIAAASSGGGYYASPTVGSVPLGTRCSGWVRRLVRLAWLLAPSFAPLQGGHGLWYPVYRTDSV